MAKNKILNFILWVVGLLVSLSIGFAMTGKLLTVPYIPTLVTVVAGWIIVSLTVIGVIAGIFSALK